MIAEQIRAILALALMAAFADGAKAEAERAEIRRIAASLAGDADPGLASHYHDVLLGRVALEDACRSLATPPLRPLAYEMAVCVCDADGLRNDA